MVDTATLSCPEVRVAVPAGATVSPDSLETTATAGWMASKPNEDEATTQARLNEAKRLATGGCGDDKPGIMLLLDYSG
ncbi:hypothetical protein StoSoilB5_14390 [Arthrobacter sp. StoSoilB5]|nr:hypothetical protein StoSoilB5_14390 [Arthrobacter sp. StoSoilB5]